MSGQPGAGCDDPRRIHQHWCGFCGAAQLFSQGQCQQLRMIPPCPRCGEKRWRGDVDEVTAPEIREQEQ